MSDKKIQAGSSVESHCNKCKTVTDHYVIVMDGDQIAKVECKVCSGRHAFKDPNGSTTKAAKTATRSAAAREPRTPRVTLAQKKSAAMQEQWEKAVNGANPRPYGMQNTFRAGDVVDHPTFGLGSVLKVMRPNTIEVQFQDEIRNMRCGGER